MVDMRVNHEVSPHSLENPTNITLKGLKCAVIVAHPDDETLWAGGTLLMNPDNDWTIITTCRKDDPDRAPKFFAALDVLNARGGMGDLDDGPDQLRLKPEQVQQTVLSLLPERAYDLIFTHSPQGEYTRHRRHEEVAEAVLRLIESRQLKTKNIKMFAYEDGQRSYLPRPIKSADEIVPLSGSIWKQKCQIVKEIYGFPEDSWEARTTPQEEAFWNFHSVRNIREWMRDRSIVT